MIAILSLLFVVVISLLIVRVATVALTLTGLSRELARFQARSAFTGSGFTTQESEQIMQHPVRRRIIMLLMLLGNAGIVTVISSLFLSLTSESENGSITDHLWFCITVLAGGLAGLSFLAYSSWLVQKDFSTDYLYVGEIHGHRSTRLCGTITPHGKLCRGGTDRAR
ncbi:MAG: hypothetical protein P8M30_20545 [Planctomycetaceae bacterium]|nr:hypothetical protein [Planctomycetaceae bacterium]MDG2391703.1 hypothetical protein [Planctomycetaceae bacterium]